MFNYDAVIGNEVIDFQVNSKLGKMLTAIFQDVLDYKEKLDYSGVPNIDESRRKFRISSVADYFIHTSVPRLQKAVLECCNLEIKYVECSYGDLMGMTGMFGMDMVIADMDIDEMFETKSRITGDMGQQQRANIFFGNIPIAKVIRTGQTDKYLEELMSISDIFDKKEARLKSRTFGKSKRAVYARKLYFDINAAFLSDEYVSASVVEPLIAEEVAAIIIHEIGHAMTMIEHCGDLYYMKSRFESFCLNIKSVKLTDADCTKLLNSIDKVLVKGVKTKVKNCASMDSTIKNDIVNKLDNISAAINVVNRDEDAKSGTNFFADILRGAATLYRILVADVRMIIIICVTQFVDYLLMYLQCLALIPIFTETRNRNVRDRNASGGKASDIGASRNQKFVLERWADDFVAKQGFAQYQVSGLHKVRDIIDYSALNGNYFWYGSIRLKESIIMQMLIDLGFAFLKILHMSWFCDSPDYENPYRRALRLLQDTYSFFKYDEKIPKKMVIEWINKVKKMEQDAEKDKRLIDTKPGQVFFKLVTTLISPAAWFDYVYNGNLSSDLKLLGDNLDDMTNNKLFYLSDKLKFRQ